jgi:hypothetical protein
MRGQIVLALGHRRRGVGMPGLEAFGQQQREVVLNQGLELVRVLEGLIGDIVVLLDRLE